MFAAEAWVAGKIVLQINNEMLDEFAVNKMSGTESEG